MIRTLAAQEFRRLFATPLAWLILAGLQLILGWLFLGQVDAFLAVQPQFVELVNPPGVTEVVALPLFSSAALLLMLAAPLLTMRSIAGERRDRTFALLLSSPLSMSEIVLGKFAGLYAFLALTLLLPALMATSLALGGTIDGGLIAANLLGLLLLAGAFAALGLFISSLTTHPTLAAFGTFGFLLALWLVSLGALEPGSLVHGFSLLKHFESFNRGLLSSADAAFFVAFAVLFLALAIRRLELEAGGVTRRARLRHATLAGLAMLATVAVALLAQRYPQSWDITRNHRHSLSPATLKVLKQMPGPVSVTAYASPQDVELGDIRKFIHDFVADYRLVKPDLTLTFVDPAAAPEQAREAGIQANGELVLRYGKRHENLSSLNEQAFTNTLLRLTRNRPPALFLDGHGERRPGGSAPHDLGQFARQLANRGIKAQGLNLGGIAEIPRTTALVVIAGGQTELLPGEAEKLRSYLERGGNLLWLVEPGSLHGLQPLVETLGLSLPTGTLLDPQARREYAVPAALPGGYGRHAATAEFDLDTVFPLARPLSFNEGGGWRYTPLAETTPEAWAERDTPDEDAEFDPQRDIAGPATIAAALERQVEDRNQRVVVVGSAAFAANAYLGLGGNLDFALNLVNWLAGDDELIAIQPKTARDARLNLSRNYAIALMLGFLIVLPLLFLALGARVWWRRRQ